MRFTVMPNRSRLLLTVVSVICICLPAFAQQLAPGGASSPDEVALRALIVKYFDTYAKKDLDAFMALWIKDAPGGDARRQRLQGRFFVEGYNDHGALISFTTRGSSEQAA